MHKGYHTITVPMNASHWEETTNLLLKDSLPATLNSSDRFSSSSEYSLVDAAAALAFKLIALTFSSIFCSSESPTDSVSDINASLSLFAAACDTLALSLSVVAAAVLLSSSAWSPSVLPFASCLFSSEAGASGYVVAFSVYLSPLFYSADSIEMGFLLKLGKRGLIDGEMEKFLFLRIFQSLQECSKSG